MNKSEHTKQMKIILFLCNWGPHAAFLELQDKMADIPDEINMVRVPCTGRIDRALILQAFSRGADGVALVGCYAGSCRYGSGTATAQRNTEDMGKILETMGIDSSRLRNATFLPDDAAGLLNFLQSLTRDIQTLGQSKTNGRDVRPIPTHSPTPANLQELIAHHDIYACQDCGKCSSACPLALTGKAFSPRAIASAVMVGDLYAEGVRENVWSCLTCGVCYDRCPSAVNFPEFIKDLRSLYREKEVVGHETHGGFFRSLMHTMTSPEISPKRYRDLPEEIEIDKESKTLFYGGCAPYFDIFFGKHADLKTNQIIHDSLRLLNFFDVKPRLLEDEKCCGHDLLWAGDRKNFSRLAKLNVDRLHELGIERLITSCPECYMTFKTTYPREGVQVNFDVVHMHEFLEEKIESGAVAFEALGRQVTFQDSCRLTRLEDKAELPRKLLARLQTESFTEMKDSGKSSTCCGNCAWTGCDAYSKAMQVTRLKQARDTGSDLLITSCPKCQIHLKCAMEDPFRKDELAIEMMDLTTVIAKTIRWA